MKKHDIFLTLQEPIQKYVAMSYWQEIENYVSASGINAAYTVAH